MADMTLVERLRDWAELPTLPVGTSVLLKDAADQIQTLTSDRNAYEHCGAQTHRPECKLAAALAAAKAQGIEVKA